MKDLQELQALHLKSTRNLVKLGACGGAPANRSKWNVPVSEFAQLTHNPIRAIVEGLKIVPNPEKPLIALSIGEFDNLLPSAVGNLDLPTRFSVKSCVTFSKGQGEPKHLSRTLSLFLQSVGQPGEVVHHAFPSY